MTRRTSIVHLIGFPASGKYTIAKALAHQAAVAGDRFIVIDNHLTSNVIFTALDVDGIRQLPPTVWARVAEVREPLYATIEELSPREWSFVFTNVLTDQDPDDAKIVERIARLAAERSSHYVPILITCQTDELVLRVTNRDRRERLKWIDPVAIRAFVNASQLLHLRQYQPLEIDVTRLPPEGSAGQIIEHVRALSRRS